MSVEISNLPELVAQLTTSDYVPVVHNGTTYKIKLGAYLVRKSEAEAITGVKTFSVSPIVPAGSASGETVNYGQLSALNNAAVKLTGDQTIAGIKTFSSSPLVPTPTTGTQAANRAYVLSVIGASAMPIGSVIFQGPNDADPATLYPGTTWSDVSWEEANMTRRTAGSLAGARFTGVPAHLTVTISAGVPTIAVTSGGSGYLSGGTGTLPLKIAGTCTTQMVATANVTSGVIVSITVNTAGAGYTSGLVAVYDGVAGHGDLVHGHVHIEGRRQTQAMPSTIYAYGVSGGSNQSSDSGTANGTQNYQQGNTSSPVTDGLNGTPRTGAETSGAWATVTKWRRTA